MDEKLRFDHLKWLDLWGLASAFVPPSTQRLVGVYYFSAYASWLPKAHERHQAYIGALRAKGVTDYMADFKSKDRGCKTCGATWVAHEEKESDVHLAVQFVHQAHLGSFDRALLVISDSDICSSIRIVQQTFPRLQLTVLTPPESYNLARKLRGTVPTVRIRKKHLYRNLLPATIPVAGGAIKRPAKYDLPPGAH